MAHDWARVRLGDLVGIRHGWPFKSELFSTDPSDHPVVVAIGNFNYSGGFRFDSTAIKRYTGDYPREYELSPGDILLVMTCQTPGGEILGVPARIPADQQLYLHNQRLGLVQRRSDSVDLGFLYWLFLWRPFNQHLVSSASGTKILHTAPTRIESFEFLLPPLHEQQAIASILGALDDKIELNRRMNQTLEEMAQAIFKSWFVDFDGHTEFEDSELGRIPKGWGLRSLYEGATFINGAAYRAFHFCPPEEGRPVVKIAELKAGVTAQTRFTNTVLAEKYRIDNNAILFSWSGNPDTSIDTFIWTRGPAWLNQHIFRVCPHRPVERTFVYLLLRHLRPTFAEIARNKQTTGLGHVTAGDMKRLPTVLPPDEVLLDFNAAADPLFERYTGNLYENQTLTEIRDTLLPKLISGEIRVAEAEKLVENVA